jgi:hypothetical protein
MEQVPKIVSQRLQATAEPAVHPDANVLAGFAEKSLTERERVQVLDHLGQCLDCRDVVLRASVELVSAPGASAERGRSGWLHGSSLHGSWLRGPVLRWGAVAACLVVVSAAVMLRRERSASTEPALVASSSRQPASGVTSENKAPETAATPTVSGGLPATNSALPSLQASRRDLTARPGAKQLARSEALKGRVPASPPAAGPDENTAAEVAEGTPPQLESRASRYQKKRELQEENQTVEVNGEAAILNTENAKVASETETVTVTAQGGPSTTLADTVTGRAKDAKEPQPKSGAGAALSLSASAAPLPAGANRQSSARTASNMVQLRNPMTLTPRWTLSPDGVLERSLDGGRTWETVPVAATAALRALAAEGFEIWVGGAAGALYHSSDIGQHWVQVTPTADGKALGADIIGITFTDASHGKLTTSNHETWITSDAGQSWERK